MSTTTTTTMTMTTGTYTYPPKFGTSMSQVGLTLQDGRETLVDVRYAMAWPEIGVDLAPIIKDALMVMDEHRARVQAERSAALQAALDGVHEDRSGVCPRCGTYCLSDCR